MNKFRISAVLCFAISALNATDVSLDGISVEDSADDGYRATTSEVGKTNTPILEIPRAVSLTRSLSEALAADATARSCETACLLASCIALIKP